MALGSILSLLLICATQNPPQEEKKASPEEKAPPQADPKPPQDKPESKPPEQPEAPVVKEEGLLDFEADLRIGAWRTGNFHAITPLGGRDIDSTIIFDAGLDLRLICSGWTLSLTADYASGKSITMEMGGILLGLQLELDPEPRPLNLEIAVGPILGRLDVNAVGFGDFQSAIGFEARVAATKWLHERIGLSLWLDYRQISFRYDEPVISGDKTAGGASFAIGAGLVMRF
jgi:hypothetical protein